MSAIMKIGRKSLVRCLSGYDFLMKLISFSLFGREAVYVKGLLRNLETVSIKLKDYVPIIFLERSSDARLVEDIQDLGGIVRLSSSDWAVNGTFWRFLALFESQAERVIFRDADSDILDRDIFAIRAWENSGKKFHIMRDHPLHSAPILAGMWGAETQEARNFIFLEDFVNYSESKGEDQNYLANIYPLIVKNALIHDDFFCYESSAQRFPIPRKECEFVGEPLDQFGIPQSKQSRLLIEKFNDSNMYRLKIRAVFWIFMFRLKVSNMKDSVCLR